MQGDKPTSLQAIMYEKLNSIMKNSNQLAKLRLCSLAIIENDKGEYSLLNAEASEEERNEALKYLLDHYQELFNEPKGLPPARVQDQEIPLEEGAQPVMELCFHVC